MKKSAINYLSQALLIIFSVVLALYLNEYINDIHKKEDIRTAVTNLRLELERNKKNIEKLIPYHEKVIQKIKRSFNDKELLDSISSDYGIDLQLFAPNGIFQRLNSKTAWETAKYNNILPLLDYKTIELLTKTYNQQEITFLPAMKMVEILASREALKRENAKDTMILMRMHFNELTGREYLLLRYYKEVLKDLERY